MNKPRNGEQKRVSLNARVDVITKDVIVMMSTTKKLSQGQIIDQLVKSWLNQISTTMK